MTTTPGDGGAGTGPGGGSGTGPKFRLPRTDTLVNSLISGAVAAAAAAVAVLETLVLRRPE